MIDPKDKPEGIEGDDNGSGGEGTPHPPPSPWPDEPVESGGGCGG